MHKTKCMYHTLIELKINNIFQFFSSFACFLFLYPLCCNSFTIHVSIKSNTLEWKKNPQLCDSLNAIRNVVQNEISVRSEIAISPTQKYNQRRMQTKNSQITSRKKPIEKLRDEIGSMCILHYCIYTLAFGRCSSDSILYRNLPNGLNQLKTIELNANHWKEPNSSRHIHTCM